MYVCIGGGGGECHLGVSAHEGLKRAADPLELALQVVVSCLAWCWELNWDLQEQLCTLNHFSSPFLLFFLILESDKVAGISE